MSLQNLCNEALAFTLRNYQRIIYVIISTGGVFNCLPFQVTPRTCCGKEYHRGLVHKGWYHAFLPCAEDVEDSQHHHDVHVWVSR